MGGVVEGRGWMMKERLAEEDGRDKETKWWEKWPRYKVPEFRKPRSWIWKVHCGFEGGGSVLGRHHQPQTRDPSQYRRSTISNSLYVVPNLPPSIPQTFAPSSLKDHPRSYHEDWQTSCCAEIPRRTWPATHTSKLIDLDT